MCKIDLYKFLSHTKDGDASLNITFYDISMLLELHYMYLLDSRLLDAYSCRVL